MKFNIMTLFPDETKVFLSSSIIGNAQENGYVNINYYNIRDYTLNKHKKVDDYAYGGGKGMLMQVEPIYRCSMDIKKNDPDTHFIYMSPKGKRFTQSKAKKLLKYSSITFLCGHYEGIDERAIELIVDEELSIGDFVLTGGELASMVVIDAVSRMVDGVLAEASCFENESIYCGLLEHPQYTRPSSFMGLNVPEVLQNGDHGKIEKWKLEQSLNITKERRKDLYSAYLKKKKK